MIGVCGLLCPDVEAVALGLHTCDDGDKSQLIAFWSRVAKRPYVLVALLP
jgi:hypothetical protein